MRKSTHPLMQLLVMLALALLFFLFVAIITALFTVGGVGMHSPSAICWMQAFTQLFVFMLPVVLMTVIYYRGSLREYYRLDFGGRRWVLGLAGVAIMMLLVPLNDWLTIWNDSWDLGRVGEMLRGLQDSSEEVLDQIVTTDTVGGLLRNLLVVALIPAVCEEVFFRAGFQNLIQRWLKNPHVAIWLTAIIFSLLHGEVFSFMPRFVMGAVLGYLYVYGGSVLPNMLAHFANNAIVVVLYWLVARGVIDIDPAEPFGFGWPIIASCTVAALFAGWVTFFRGDDCRRALKV